MKSTIDARLEHGRVRDGDYGTDTGDLNGAFFVQGPLGRILRIVASNGDGWAESDLPGEPWEHVSVSLAEYDNATPSWREMHFVKRLFWRDDETVMQLHPPEAAKVNVYEGCLHLWKPTRTEILLPPQACV